MSQMLAICMKELAEGTHIFKAQLPHLNPIIICSMFDRNIGGNVSDFVHDIQHLEQTGQVHENTWVPAGDHYTQCYSRNTMGYQMNAGGKSS